MCVCVADTDKGEQEYEARSTVVYIFLFCFYNLYLLFLAHVKTLAILCSTYNGCLMDG